MPVEEPPMSTLWLPVSSNPSTVMLRAPLKSRLTMSTVPSAGWARTRVREVIAALVVIAEPDTGWVTQIVLPLFEDVRAAARASRVATDTSHEPGCGVGDGVGVGVGDG